MAHLSELLKGGNLPSGIVAMSIWNKIEGVQQSRPRPHNHAYRQQGENIFYAGMQERPSRKRVRTHVTRCAPSYTGEVRRGSDVIVCRKRVL